MADHADDPMTLDELRRELRKLDRTSRWLQHQLWKHSNRLYGFGQRVVGGQDFGPGDIGDAIKALVKAIVDEQRQAASDFNGHAIERLRHVIDPEPKR